MDLRNNNLFLDDYVISIMSDNIDKVISYFGPTEDKQNDHLDNVITNIDTEELVLVTDIVLKEEEIERIKKLLT